MAFRMPRLGRSGQEFAREVVIVIVGVLVALALEQVVASWRDRVRAADIRASMDEELSDFIAVFDVRAVASRCINAKLDALDAALAGHPQPPFRNVGRPQFFFSSHGAWNSDAADLLARHLGPATLRTYGEAYQGMAEFAALAQREQDEWIVLQTLERPGEPIARERRWRLIEAAAGARNTNLLLTAIAEQMNQRIAGLGVRAASGQSPASGSGRGRSASRSGPGRRPGAESFVAAAALSVEAFAALSNPRPWSSDAGCAPGRLPLTACQRRFPAAERKKKMTADKVRALSSWVAAAFVSVMMLTAPPPPTRS